MKPNYQLRCRLRCTDRFRRPRYGSQWVHIHGITSWVCDACAEFLAASAGLPSDRQRRLRIRREAIRLQLPLDAALFEDQVHGSLGEVDRPCEIQSVIAGRSA